jgi:N-acetylglutamate synthase-like GNAT family acetyltransferase
MKECDMQERHLAGLWPAVHYAMQDAGTHPQRRPIDHCLHDPVGAVQARSSTLAGPVVVRRAAASDQPEIIELVRSERLNPNNLDWQRFLVASDSVGLAGAVQLRHHADGSFELGSLVVRADQRRRGVAAMMIDTLLGDERRRVMAITRRELVPFFERWGFAPVRRRHASAGVRLNHLIGSLVSVWSWFRGEPPRRLVILQRDTPPAAAGWFPG